MFRFGIVHLKVLHSVGKSRRGKKIDFLNFLIFGYSLMRVEGTLKKVRSEMTAFSRNHMISVDFGDLSGTR